MQSLSKILKNSLLGCFFCVGAFSLMTNVVYASVNFVTSGIIHIPHLQWFFSQTSLLFIFLLGMLYLCLFLVRMFASFVFISSKELALIGVFFCSLIFVLTANNFDTLLLCLQIVSILNIIIILLLGGDNFDICVRYVVVQGLSYVLYVVAADGLIGVPFVEVSTNGPGIPLLLAFCINLGFPCINFGISKIYSRVSKISTWIIPVIYANVLLLLTFKFFADSYAIFMLGVLLLSFSLVVAVMTTCYEKSLMYIFQSHTGYLLCFIGVIGDVFWIWGFVVIITILQFSAIMGCHYLSHKRRIQWNEGDSDIFICNGYVLTGVFLNLLVWAFLNIYCFIANMVIIMSIPVHYKWLFWLFAPLNFFVICWRPMWYVYENLCRNIVFRTVILFRCLAVVSVFWIVLPYFLTFDIISDNYLWLSYGVSMSSVDLIRYIAFHFIILFCLGMWGYYIVSYKVLERFSDIKKILYVVGTPFVYGLFLYYCEVIIRNRDHLKRCFNLLLSRCFGLLRGFNCVSMLETDTRLLVGFVLLCFLGILLITAGYLTY